MTRPLSKYRTFKIMVSVGLYVKTQLSFKHKKYNFLMSSLKINLFIRMADTQIEVKMTIFNKLYMLLAPVNKNILVDNDKYICTFYQIHFIEYPL